jgi:hypothetical protein
MPNHFEGQGIPQMERVGWTWFDGLWIYSWKWMAEPASAREATAVLATAEKAGDSGAKMNSVAKPPGQDACPF